MPGEQAPQLEAPAKAAKVPAGQGLQLVDAASPVNEPASQLMHVAAPSLKLLW